MHNFIRIILFFFILNISSVCFAIGVDTPVKIFTLQDGHKVVIKEVHANPIVTVDTWVKTGSAQEGVKNNGISHFLEHLMFKGTKNHKNGEIEKILESKGARFNAGTSKDFTHYYVTTASDYVDTAIDLHADMMQNPVIPIEEMNKERKVVQEEIRRAQDNHKRTLLNNLFTLIFKKHPYRLTTLGSHDVIENVSRDEMMDYYHERYTPANLTTIIVGDVDTQKVLKQVKESFHPKFVFWSQSYMNKTQREAVAIKPSEIVEKGDYKSGYLYLGYKGVAITSVKESYALDMAASILGGSSSSRLYQNLKENQGLVSAISSAHFSMKDDSVFLVSADFSPEKLDAVKAAILDEVKQLREKPVTKEELSRAKTLSKRGFVYANESVENIANSIGYCMTTMNNIDCYTKHIEYVEAVTLADIQTAVKKYLDPNKLAFSVLLPEELNVNNVTSNKTVIKELTRSELSNGSVLITGKNISNDIIAMNVIFKGGAFLQPAPGSATLLTKTLKYGTKNRPYLELIKELEELGVSINPGASSDSFSINLKATEDNFDKAFEILADIIKNPTFEEKYIEKNKKDIITGIKKSRDRPISIASEKFITEMYKGHPYGERGYVIEEKLPDVTREQVVKYWSEIFIPENMIVSVSGNVDHDKLAQKLTSVFSASGKKPLKANYSNEFKPLSKNKKIKTDYDSSTAWVLMGWPVDNVKNEKEVLTFKIIDNVLSGGLSSRLHVSFREKQGLAYAVGSSYSPKMDKGHFVLFIGTEPKNEELVKRKFLEEIELLKTKPLSKKELEDTKNKIIGKYALSQETNQQKASLLGNIELIDKEFGFNYDFPSLIKEVTAEDVLNTANKYFSKPYVISVVAPVKKEDK